MGRSLPGFSIHGIFQARILEWVAISFPKVSSWPRDQTQVSQIAGRRFSIWATTELKEWKKRVKLLFATSWTNLEYIMPSEVWSGEPFPSPGDLPNPGIKPRSPILQADSLPAEPQGKPKNTGVGSLSLLHGIFPTQESNQGHLHCRYILYQLSYHGSPVVK